MSRTYEHDRAVVRCSSNMVFRIAAQIRLTRLLVRSLRAVVTTAVTALLLTACQASDRQGSSRSADVDTTAVMATIDSMRTLYERSVATGDFESMGSLLAEGAVMVGPGGPQWDSLRAASELPWPPGATLEISPIEVRVLSDEWAYEFGTSTATYTPTGASAPRTLRDTYLILFRNTADGWKLYREVASPDLPTSTRPDQ